MNKINQALAVVAGLMLLVLLIVIAWRWSNPSAQSRQAQIVTDSKIAADASASHPPVASPAAALATAKPAADAIKVGWMVSLFTIDEHPYAKGVGLDSITAIRPRFIDPQIDLYAILEDGTADDGRVRDVLAKYFPPGHVINGTDAAALSKLDVIVCSRDWNMRPAMMKAILAAVNNGTGLLRHLAAGIFNDEGDDADRDAINCIDDAKFFWTRDAINCVVVSDHPLLAGIRKSLPEGKLTIANVNGAIGVVHGTPLIVAEEGSEGAGEVADGLPATLPAAGGAPATAPTDRRIFCPIFISQIGKGRVVACQWDSIPRPLADATAGRFYIHCVQWLANRPVK